MSGEKTYPLNFTIQERQAKAGELVRCRWCHCLPVISHRIKENGVCSDYVGIRCNGGYGEKECSAYPSTDADCFGHVTGYIASLQWASLNSLLQESDFETPEKYLEALKAETLEKLDRENT